MEVRNTPAARQGTGEGGPWEGCENAQEKRGQGRFLWDRRDILLFVGHSEAETTGCWLSVLRLCLEHNTWHPGGLTTLLKFAFGETVAAYTSSQARLSTKIVVRKRSRES